MTLVPTECQWMQVRVLDLEWSQPEEIGSSTGKLNQLKSFNLQVRHRYHICAPCASISPPPKLVNDPPVPNATGKLNQLKTFNLQVRLMSRHAYYVLLTGYTYH